MNNGTVTPGIRGWLILLVFLLFGAPSNFITHARFVAREFDKPMVLQFTDPSSPTYDARWPLFIDSETTVFSALAFVVFFVLWPLFFFRHRFFPGAFAIVSVLVAGLLAFRVVLAASIPTIAPPHRQTIYGQTALWLPISLSRAAYAVRSRRARITFRHRLMLYPVFPFFTRA